ncbi:MAG: glycosyltransferase family 4 protein [Actinobacteria bacterium]|nr:glycosyltransferase family 4 protein [Actinomycetota bacterium]
MSSAAGEFAGTEALRERADALGLKRVWMLAWRDLDDPEAGGSELHAHRVAERLAAAGIDLEMRTSMVPSQPVHIERAGYQVERRSGRYGVFPSVAMEGLRRKARDEEGLIEIWNGMPFFSPLWWKGPRVVLLHHVHAEMWKMALGTTLGAVGRSIEHHLAPPCYRRCEIVTLSDSSREEILERLGMQPERVAVVHPGVEATFSPGGGKSPTPLIVSVGRLVPVKRYELLITSLVEAKKRHKDLHLIIVGEGYQRDALEAEAKHLGAQGWVSFAGRLNDEELLDLYRRASLVASASLREGWGMTLTEAAACGTPAVASDIAGHRDAVDAGRSGLLVKDAMDIGKTIADLLDSPERLSQLSEGALARAAELSWDATASGVLEAFRGQFPPLVQR